MDGWDACFKRILKKGNCKKEDGWTKKLRLLARKWNRQGERLRRGVDSGSVRHREVA